MSAISRTRDSSLGVPAVSVGMPAYNSAAWIEAAIDSILGQSFRDLELIISDNASTDATVTICERYARSDPRVRLLRNPTNLGANRNYMAVLRAARGKYFKWASSNDICAPTFIEKCVERLDSDLTAVVACTRSCIFERAVEAAQPYDRDLELTAEEPAVRFKALYSRMALNNVFNGLIRRSALMRVSTMGSYMGADIVLMGELALLGKFLLIDEPLFFRRMSSDSATKLKSEREAEIHLVPTARGPLKWQSWRFQFGLLRSARLAAFPSRDWFQTVSYGMRTFVWTRRTLLREVLRGIQ